MKLVELLARELKEWPEGNHIARQDADWEICFDPGDSASDFTPSIEAEDNEHDGTIGSLYVTRAQWEAERARILLESQPERDADVAKVVDAGKSNNKEDQALWDKVYFRAWELIAMDDRELEYIMRAAANASDAFMAERAKRMKG